jgi:hypothetical protein
VVTPVRYSQSIPSTPTNLLSQGKTVGLFAGLLVVHGLLVSLPPPSALLFDLTPLQNSVSTKYLARFTQYFVFVNLGATARAFPFSELRLCLTSTSHHYHPSRDDAPL